MTRKRFIAGAICPRCSELDTTYVLDDDNGRSRHCVKCDFKDGQPTARRESDWQTVRIATPEIDPDKESSP